MARRAGRVGQLLAGYPDPPPMPPERTFYRLARIAHHAELVVVTTSAIAEITTEGQLLALLP